ncbi:alpha-mannosidase [Velocimicrobium porci]|uniref:Alpha-mannosidase n=1 Tax=Velocimicrobium porci TaxID=2606634 RepID=A0A6L5Y119_9FIRM|nr:alpha-mannosidase [Velocimicrobium porci]MSS64836.1 alpha-mannosidase [Velocimicrobium porci]
MFYTEQKLEARVAEIQNYRYRDVIGLEELQVKEDTLKEVNPNVPVEFENWDSLKIGDTWKGRDKYLWLHKTVTIPAKWKGRKVLGIFDYGNTGAGNNSGFESLLYLNEKPYQGVDVNHKEVFLEEELIGREVEFTFRLWSGLEGGGVPREQEHRINRADLAWLDEPTDDLYYLSLMLVDTLKNLAESDPVRLELKKYFDQAFQMIDWAYPGSEEFYESVHRADEFLNQKIDAMDKHSLIEVKCVGHTHIDMAWLWRLKHTREKASRSFSTVLRLMDQYPEYIFLQTQPKLYEYVKQDFPEIYEKIKEKVKDGSWEVDGAMWVEADCNLTSGESLTRQILIGSRFIKEEFQKDVEYLWLPDVFGYSWALPQILKKSGIDMFMTTKISWNQYNRMPHDTFIWRGIDGSEVITHFITTPEPDSTPDSWFYTYNGKLTPKTVKGVWEAYKDKDLNQELLISYGYGDGGGGVNRDMLEQRRRLDKIPGLPAVKTSTAREFFRDLKDKVRNTNQYVHTWDGELYLEYHRGTYTSHAYNKRMNRKLEYYYRETEWLTAWAAALNGNLCVDNQERLTEGWKILLTNQFHDIIPGSSIKEVYDDTVEDYERAYDIANNVWNEAKDMFITSSENQYTIINNSNFKRTESVFIPFEGKKGFFKDENGKILKSQLDNDIWKVEVNNILPMGFATITFEEAEMEVGTSCLQLSKERVETPYYLILLNEYGQIVSLYDKEYKRQVIKEGEKANVLQFFEDKPMGNDAWDIDIYYQEKMREVNNLVQIEVKECGPVRGVISMEWSYMNSTIRQDMIVYSNNRRIDFKTFVSYHEKHQLLKVAFPVDIRSTYATYDIQYGNVKRPNNWNTSWEQARFETVGHRFADLSEHNYGVSLMNNCKYGYDVKGHTLRLTLLKAATHPDYLQDQGEHEFTYSLLPHERDCVGGDTVREAFFLNQPLKAVKGACKVKQMSFLDIDSEQVEVDAVKLSEDKKYLVLRIHEYTGSTQMITLTPGIPIKGYMESDLMERPIEEMKKEAIICTKIKPYEIKTFLLEI